MDLSGWDILAKMWATWSNWGWEHTEEECSRRREVPKALKLEWAWCTLETEAGVWDCSLGAHDMGRKDGRSSITEGLEEHGKEFDFILSAIESHW